MHFNFFKQTDFIHPFQIDILIGVQLPSSYIHLCVYYIVLCSASSYLKPPSKAFHAFTMSPRIRLLYRAALKYSQETSTGGKYICWVLVVINQSVNVTSREQKLQGLHYVSEPNLWPNYLKASLHPYEIGHTLRYLAKALHIKSPLRTISTGEGYFNSGLMGQIRHYLWSS